MIARLALLFGVCLSCVLAADPALDNTFANSTVFLDNVDVSGYQAAALDTPTGERVPLGFVKGMEHRCLGNAPHPRPRRDARSVVAVGCDRVILI